MTAPKCRQRDFPSGFHPPTVVRRLPWCVPCSAPQLDQFVQSMNANACELSRCRQFPCPTVAKRPKILKGVCQVPLDAQRSAVSFPLNAHCSTLFEKSEMFICDRTLMMRTKRPLRMASLCKNPKRLLRSWSGIIGSSKFEPCFTASRKSKTNWLSAHTQKHWCRLSANWYADIQAIYSPLSTDWKRPQTGPWAIGTNPSLRKSAAQKPQLAKRFIGSAGWIQLPSVKRCNGPWVGISAPPQKL